MDRNIARAPRIALFPGSFDPFTKGHYEITMRALALFDRIVLAVGNHAGKSPLFPLSSRLAIIQDLFRELPGRIEITSYDSLTVDICKEVHARWMIRGLRSGSDFDYEHTIAQANSMLAPDIETLFLIAHQQDAPIASSVVRDILIHGGDPSPFLPEGMDLSRYASNLSKR